jgi:hypothetical protein
MSEYIDFLIDQRNKNVVFLKEAASVFDYATAAQLQSDIAFLSWVIDDMTQFNLSGRHL